MRVLAVFLLCSAVAGCATEGMSIPIGPQRSLPSTSMDDITILMEPPAQAHEIIALVEGVASTDDYLSERRTQEAALKAMKKEAARIGANAIVLTAKGREPYAQVTVGSGTATANANIIGGAVFGSGYYTSTATTFGWQKIRVGGTAVRFLASQSSAR
jgi:hypothetical protein